MPLVYDVHHHRCNPDGMSVEQATKKALATWNREPMFHISSPIEGWDGPKPERHHDFIDVKDFPTCWRRKKITVEVEAKAKEVAVEKLSGELKNAKTLDEVGLSISCVVQTARFTPGSPRTWPVDCKQHNAGTASQYTCSRLPVVLVYQEARPDHSLALETRVGDQGSFTPGERVADSSGRVILSFVAET